MEIVAGDGIAGTYVRVRPGQCLHTSYNVRGAVIYYRVQVNGNGSIIAGTSKAVAFELIPGEDAPDYEAICQSMELKPHERDELKRLWPEMLAAE